MPVEHNFALVAEPVKTTLQTLGLQNVYVAEIDAALADTTSFCEQYGIELDVSANCVIIEAKRAGEIWHAACMILATNKVDVNGVVRRFLDASKTSFASMDSATSLTRMMYGGITPIGLPANWPILVDARVADEDMVIIGSGLRTSKILVPGLLLASLPSATVLDIAK